MRTRNRRYLGLSLPGPLVLLIAACAPLAPAAAPDVRYEPRGVCVDIDPERIAEARANATGAGVAERITFRQDK